MKKNVDWMLFCLAAGLWAAFVPGLQAAPRTWTNQDGKSLEAEMVRVSGDKVQLKLASNGQIYSLPVTSLSSEDQKFIEEEQVRLAEEAKNAARAQSLANRKAKWTEDWDAAKAESAATGLPIMLLMTGSDWCGYCMQLEAKVFEDRSFQKFADEHVILMKADFPHGSQKRSIKEQNAELKSQYSFSGYPTVFLLDPELKEVAKFVGYGGDSPKDYVAKVEAKLPK